MGANLSVLSPYSPCISDAHSRFLHPRIHLIVGRDNPQRDVGLIPWVMLADSSESPLALAQRCRDVIDQQAPAGERENLLAVVQVLARLRYNDPSVFAILGGKKTMIESPLIDEIVSEAESKTSHKLIIEVLRTRFGQVSTELEDRIRSVLDNDTLTLMTRSAAACRDLETFQESLA